MNYDLTAVRHAFAAVLLICGVLPVAADMTILPDKPIWSASDARTPKLAKGGPNMAFELATVPTNKGPRPLLFIAFRFAETFADRFSQAMPAPIFVAAVNRATGAVYLRELTRDDDPPVAVNLPGPAPKSVWQVNGLPVEGPLIQIGGHVTVNLISHLGLPQVAGVYDVFLWIDEFATDMQAVKISGDAVAAPEPALHRRPDSILSLQAAQVGALEAALSGVAADARISGRSPGGPVTVLALSTVRRQVGWARAAAQGGGGLAFAVKAEELVGRLGQGERVVAWVFANGVRSRLLDSAAVRP